MAGFGLFELIESLLPEDDMRCRLCKNKTVLMMSCPCGWGMNLCVRCYSTHADAESRNKVYQSLSDHAMECLHGSYFQEVLR